MKKFLISVLLVALLATLVPAAQAQDKEVTLTVQTISAPGGCLITLEGIDAGQAKGYTAQLLGSRLLAGQFFDFEFEGSISLYTVGSALISFDGNTIFINCFLETKDLYVYVNGGKILSATNQQKTELDVFEAEYPIIAALPELASQLQGVANWQYVGSIVPGEKTFHLTLSQ